MQIGPPRIDEGPLDLFLACHGRIRENLAGLGALASLEDWSDPRARPTAAACARYLRVGLPLHGVDEDRSLAPRLRAVRPGDAVLQALDRMEEEHHEMERGLPDLLTRLDSIAHGERPDLGPAWRWLSALMEGHLALEETVVFPAMARLPASELEEIAREIVARRR